MRRIYFLVPSEESASQIVNELLLERIEHKHIHIIANHRLELQALPEASVLESSDLVPAMERGMAIGGISGLLAGLVALAFPPVGVLAGGAVILGSALAGAGIGAWASSMIGISAPNSRLKEYEKAIARGELLMLIDVPTKRVEEIEAVVAKHHPEAEIHGAEPTIPAFP